jgi:hypothetical protein
MAGALASATTVVLRAVIGKSFSKKQKLTR